MRGFLRHAAWIVLLVAGLAALGGYGFIVASADDAVTKRDAAILAGFGAALLVAGGLVVAGLRLRRDYVTFPPFWVGGVGFVVAIVTGAVAVRSDRWPILDPLLAVLAIGATYFAFAAVAVRWARGRAAKKRMALGPTLWGMTAAPTLALTLELICAVGLMAGGAVGLYIADPDLLRTLSDSGVESVIEESGNDLVSTTTVIIGIGAMYAVIAPLVEEFAKLLGTIVFLRRESATRFDAYISGVFAGLGFASVETLAYALAAGEQWPLLAALRAPIAVVHVTAAVAAALGWFAGGRSIVGGYALAVLIHGAWNGLTVAVLVITASIADPESIPPAAALATMLIFGGMALLITACTVWFVRAARRFGSDTIVNDPPARTGTTLGLHPIGGHTSPISGSTFGSV